MDTARTHRLVEQHAMACAGAAKALAELREARERDGDSPALRALDHRLRQELDEHRRRMHALVSAGDGPSRG